MKKKIKKKKKIRGLRQEVNNGARELLTSCAHIRAAKVFYCIINFGTSNDRVCVRVSLVPGACA